MQITDCAGVSNEGWGLQSKADPQGSGGSSRGVGGWIEGWMGGGLMAQVMDCSTLKSGIRGQKVQGLTSSSETVSHPKL